MSKPKKQKQRTIRVKPYSYQPSKAELEEEIHVPGTPEEIAKSLRGCVIVEDAPKKKYTKSTS